MKSMILTLVIFSLNLDFIKLASDENQIPVVTSKIVKNAQKQLSFSFKKKNFKDFVCNFDNEKLTDLYLKKPPFYFSKPVRNFFLTFSLFLQYSLIKNNEDFRKINENLLKIYLKKIHNLSQSNSQFCYNPQSFIDHLERLTESINTILDGKNSRIVNVKERAGRIYITQNESTEDFKIKLIENFAEITFDDSQNKEIVEAMIELYTTLNEFNIQDIFQGQVLDILIKLRNEHKKRKKEKNMALEVCEEPFEVLLQNYTRLCLLMNDDDYFYAEYDERGGIKKKSDEYAILFAKMYHSGVFSFYFYNISQKTRAKAFYHFFKYPEKGSNHSFGNEEHKLNVLSFIRIVENALKDDKKVRFTNRVFDDETFENLLKICLELAL